MDFPHCRQVFQIERVRTELATGKTHREVVCGVTSRDPDRASPAQLLTWARGHWSIENRLHWVRDVTFDEDRCQVRTGHAAQLLACLRNLVISLLRLAGATQIARALRYLSSRLHASLRLLGL